MTKKSYCSRSTRLLKLGLSMLTFIVSSTIMIAQTTISGTVSDSNGITLPGVNVLIEGTFEGGSTDIDGKYQFETEKRGTYKVMFSLLGFKNTIVEVNLKGEDIILNMKLSEDAFGLNEVVITGVVNPRSKLESSVSMTTLQPQLLEQSAARTTAEVFRAIPGIKSEASAGDGNTNITVRGVPISAGGSRYLQIQEDGLPMLLYGDIAFSTQDQYLRVDQTIARVEAIRGGSAATTTSNGPAGIVNFISKSGAQEGGMIGASYGVDFNSVRTDFNYGAPINETMSFNIGGFYRQGEGARNANQLVNKGGQIKANLTKRFDGGFVRIYGKFLNDRTAAYMPMPIAVSGTNSNPTWGSVDGFSAVNSGLQSPYLNQSFGYGPDGNFRNVNITDGIHSRSNSVGASLEYNLGGGWKLTSNARMAFNSGRFVAPFTAEVGHTQAITDAIVTANGDTTATGAPVDYTINTVATGQKLTDTHNGLIQRIHLFDVELENFNNFMSDTRLSKELGRFNVTAGAFNSNQNIEMSWLWNTYLMEVGQSAELLNINAGGNDITSEGQLAYGVPFWGNCCTGKYNVNYNVLAPYVNTAVEVTDKLNVDAGVRYDYARVNGLVTPSQQIENVDMNGNGVIDAPERSVSRVDNANAKVVNYSYDYVSYSLGANYLLGKNNAVFARYSQGYVGNGERATWHQGGPYLQNQAPKNSLAQAEVGYKQRFKYGGLFATAFYANTQEEAGVEATTQNVLSNDYQSFGLELEGLFEYKGFTARGALTWVDAEIVDNDANVNIGNTPRRQPGLSYNFMPAYSFKGGHSISMSVMGQTQSYAQDNNDLIMPGYTIVNAVGSLYITKKTRLNLSVNNLTNAMGITESEEGSIVEGQTNFIRARSIPGRTMIASINIFF